MPESPSSVMIIMIPERIIIRLSPPFEDKETIWLFREAVRRNGERQHEVLSRMMRTYVSMSEIRKDRGLLTGTSRDLRTPDKTLTSSEL